MKRVRRYLLIWGLGALATMLLLWGCASLLLAQSLVRRGGVGAVAAYSPVQGEALGEIWRIQARDGVTLSARAGCQGEGHRWVLLLHGYTAGKEAMRAYADTYAAHGYHTLTPDLRAHGDSGGAYVGMGWADRTDVESWMAAIRARDPAAEILLHGVSMGGAAALAAAGERPQGLIAVVADCAYTSLWDISAYQAELYLGTALTPLRYGASLATRQLAGYGWKDASPLAQTRKIGVPTLFLHGGADRFVPVYMAYALYSAATCPKELVIVEGGGHATAQRSDPALYWESVFTFLEREVCP